MLKCYFINIDHGKQILKLMVKDIHWIQVLEYLKLPQQYSKCYKYIIEQFFFVYNRMHVYKICCSWDIFLQAADVTGMK